jgi:protein required for attachment to host cells
MNRTWILVADASFARFFELDDEGAWVLIKELEHVESREQGQDLMENRPYKTQHLEEMTAKGHNPVEFKHLEAEKFARELVTQLDQGQAANAFESLVLVAPPKFLGLLREHLSTTIRRKITMELAKDYTTLEPREMAERVPTF